MGDGGCDEEETYGCTDADRSAGGGDSIPDGATSGGLVLAISSCLVAGWMGMVDVW